MEKVSPAIISGEIQQELELLLRRENCTSAGGIDASNYTYAPSDSCPAVWDGITCWPVTLPGMLQVQKCPDYVAGFEIQEEASKLCTDAGQWFSKFGNSTTWTNYTMCYTNPLATVIVEIPDHPNASHFMPWITTLKRMKQVGYSFSLLSLIIALIILASSKRLRCPRNTLHMHLFASFILRAFMALLKDSLFIEGVGLSSDVIFKDGQTFFSQEKHNWVCKCVTSLWQFCITANYSWILMEGLYLHSLIFMALFTDSSAITLYVILGWGLPILVVIPWVIMRIFFENNLCWTTHENRSLELIITLPIILSNLINFILFLNIIRIILLKLRSSICEETRRYRYRKWGRSTLVLMPLFGVHYILFIYHTNINIGENPHAEIWALFLDQLFTSFQGFFVAILYCFLNADVRSEMNKKWYNLRWSLKRTTNQQYGGGNGGGNNMVGNTVEEGIKFRQHADSCRNFLLRNGLRRKRRSTSSFATSMIDSGVGGSGGNRRIEATASTPLCPQQQEQPPQQNISENYDKIEKIMIDDTEEENSIVELHSLKP